MNDNLVKWRLPWKTHKSCVIEFLYACWMFACILYFLLFICPGRWKIGSKDKAFMIKMLSPMVKMQSPLWYLWKNHFVVALATGVIVLLVFCCILFGNKQKAFFPECPMCTHTICVRERVKIGFLLNIRITFLYFYCSYFLLSTISPT